MLADLLAQAKDIPVEAITEATQLYQDRCRLPHMCMMYAPGQHEASGVPAVRDSCPGVLAVAIQSGDF